MAKGTLTALCKPPLQVCQLNQMLNGKYLAGFKIRPAHITYRCFHARHETEAYQVINPTMVCVFYIPS